MHRMLGSQKKTCAAHLEVEMLESMRLFAQKGGQHHATRVPHLLPFQIQLLNLRFSHTVTLLLVPT
eukprot:1207071-Rhodomonas_salina.1